MLCHAAAIQMRSADGSLPITRWSWVSAAIRIVPWFADRARSPLGKSWRSRAKASTLLPLRWCTPALRNAPEYWSLRFIGIFTVRPPIESTMWLTPPNVVRIQKSILMPVRFSSV